MRQSQYFGSSTRGLVDKAVLKSAFSILESQPNNQPQGPISASISGQAVQVAVIHGSGSLICSIAGKAVEVGSLKGSGRLISSSAGQGTVTSQGKLTAQLFQYRLLDKRRSRPPPRDQVFFLVPL